MRYSHKAAVALLTHGHAILLFGKREGLVEREMISTSWPIGEEIDTITLYLGAAHQAQFYDSIIESKPRRLIFNPGTENPELVELAKRSGIEVLEACTLVLLATGQY